MPLSELDAQILLIQEVGDVNPETGDPVQPTTTATNGIILQNIGRLWAKHADKATISARLQELFVKRDAVNLVIGILESRVDFTGVNGGITVRLNQRVLARQEQRKAFVAEIVEVQRGLRAGAVAVGLITRTEPIIPPEPGELSSPYPYGPDANGPEFSGSPYWPNRSRPPV